MQNTAKHEAHHATQMQSISVIPSAIHPLHALHTIAPLTRWQSGGQEFEPPQVHN